MEYNFDSEAKLYMVFDLLGDLERTGPLLWKVDRDRTEDVKNHVFDLRMIVRLLKDYLPDGLDYDLIDNYILCHDLPEVITGDITKFEGVSDEEIKRVTAEAIDWLAEKFDDVIDLSKYLYGFENKIDIESKFVHMIDKVQSSIPFMKYSSEGKIDVDNPDIDESLRYHPFVVKKVAEGKDVGDVFYEFHLMAVNISDEECERYNVTREDADTITNVIEAFTTSIFKRKQNNTLVGTEKEFPISAMKYNRKRLAKTKEV